MTGLEKPARRASLHTLGCRLNQSETRLLEDQLRAAGYRIVPFGQPADLGVINTCTVPAQADLKCRYEIRRFRRRNPQAFLAVIGCYAESGYRVLSAIDGIDLILGNRDKLNLLDYLGDGTRNPAPVLIRQRLDRDDFTIPLAGDAPFPQRVNLKVQDGCDFVCGFCIIPRVRGPARSRDWQDLLVEARQLVRRGVRELVLTGVNIGTYSSHGYDIVALVDALDALDGLWRIRISSIEPTTVPDALLDRMAAADHCLQPYLHLPLQAGCDRILREMRRRYSLSEYEEFARQAVARVPDLCLGTDILVGHPGESDEDFAATCAFFLRLPFAYAHVFTYSERERTLAARRTDSVPTVERQRRSARLRSIATRQRQLWNAQFIGCEMDVLIEDPQPDALCGYTANYIRVATPLPPTPVNWRNRLARVKLSRTVGEFVEADLLGLHESGAPVSTAGLLAGAAV
ncbi:MAG: MiaB/RimO family radical SAM methylthiotransferase [Opitutales bacterium]